MTGTRTVISKAQQSLLAPTPEGIKTYQWSGPAFPIGSPHREPERAGLAGRLTTITDHDLRRSRLRFGIWRAETGLLDAVAA